MNKRNLVMGVTAVPATELHYDANKETIGSLRVIREMLDHAREVPEAVTILEQVNITWDGGPAVLYLVADASGQSVLVEFHNREMLLLPSPGGAPWHPATNHLRTPLDDESSGGCWRYDTVRTRLATSRGALTVVNGTDLLSDVPQENALWSGGGPAT